MQCLALDLGHETLCKMSSIPSPETLNKNNYVCIKICSKELRFNYIWIGLVWYLDKIKVNLKYIFCLTFFTDIGIFELE